MSRFSSRQPGLLRSARRWLLPAMLAVLALPAMAAELAWVTVHAVAAAPGTTWDGQVQAERQAQVATEVPGRIATLAVRAGDRVKRGDILLQLNASSSQQQTAASRAQVATARAALDVATTELARKRQLAEKKYISQAALEQAQGQYKAARAQVEALQAQTRAAQTQEKMHVIRAPWDGIIAQVAVEEGDVAQPGQPLLVLYDPAVLRVSAHVPVGLLARSAVDGARLWLAQAVDTVAAGRIRILPTVDPMTLTQEVRALIPADTAATPGQFARLLLPASAAGAGTPERIFVPAASIVRRAEVTAVYVAAADGRPQLRQLRLGPVLGDQVEVLSGLDAGEQIAADPQAAARVLSDSRDRRGRQ